jgi:hypothetical protein
MSKAPVLLVLVLALAVGGSLVAASSSTPAPAAYGVEVDLAPLADHPDGYRCHVAIRDLATNEVLAAPQLVFPKGQDAATQTTIPGTDRLASLTVEVADDGTLTYELEVRSGEEVVSHHKATVALEG